MTILNDPNEKSLVVIKSKVVDGKLTDSAAAALLRTEFNKYENTNDEVMISVAPLHNSEVVKGFCQFGVVLQYLFTCRLVCLCF